MSPLLCCFIASGAATRVLPWPAHGSLSPMASPQRKPWNTSCGNAEAFGLGVDVNTFCGHSKFLKMPEKTLYNIFRRICARSRTRFWCSCQVCVLDSNFAAFFTCLQVRCPCLAWQVSLAPAADLRDGKKRARGCIGQPAMAFHDMKALIFNWSLRCKTDTGSNDSSRRYIARADTAPVRHNTFAKKRAQNFRWIRCCWFQVSLDSRNFPKMQAFGVFRGRMSSWCSFRCTCLDELESKSGLKILYLFLLQNVCIPCYSDCEAHGWFFLVWRLLWCCDLVHDKMVVLTIDQQQFRWIRCCWFQASLDWIFFQNAGFWPLPGQNVFFLASSGAECLPGVHSDVRI